MHKVVNLLEYRDSKLRTNDKKWTQGGLQERIKQIVHKVNTTDDSDEDIADFIAKCFTINGIIDTYNQMGLDGWDCMITQMAEYEVWERRRNGTV
ncbi:MAG: hypothetical protein NC247_02205 [Ruminococcus flavefaciens]|nr:hypothetical protein [Ruminococcus flavefaciens]